MGSIYLIRNLINDKVYVGQTRQKIETRFSYHRSMLRAEKHDNDYLQKAWNKYGEKSFEFSILEDGIESQENLNQKEIYYISEYAATDRLHGYNLREGGNASKFSQDAIKSISMAQKKRFTRPEERKRLSDKAVVRYKTEEGKKFASERSKQTWKNHRDKMLQLLSVAREKAVMARAKHYNGFISPDGRIHKNIFNLRAFCRNNGLTYSSMQRVNWKQLNHHRGWTRYDG